MSHGEFKAIGDTKYFKYKDCTEGQELVTGEFVREFDGLYNKQYEFLDDAGDVVVLNHSAKLAAKLRFANPGDRVRIIYDGQTMVSSGPMAGKPMHLFKVAIAKQEKEVVEPENKKEEVTLVDEFSEDLEL